MRVVGMPLSDRGRAGSRVPGSSRVSEWLAVHREPPKWADATPGNLLALKSGEWSPRFVDPLAADLGGRVPSPAVTWWQEADRPAIWRWAQAEACHQLRVEYLADNRDDMTDDEVRAQEAHLDKLAGTAERMGSKLGLDPLSRARWAGGCRRSATSLVGPMRTETAPQKPPMPCAALRSTYRRPKRTPDGPDQPPDRRCSSRRCRDLR